MKMSMAADDKRLKMQRVGKLMIFFSPVLLIIAGVLYFRTASFIERAERTEGEIIEMVARSGSKGSTTYAPVFTFADASGASHTIHSSTSSYPPRYHVGEKVTVLYDPKLPKDATLDGFFSLWGITVILGGMGILELIMGYIFIWFYSATRSKAKQSDEYGVKPTQPEDYN